MSASPFRIAITDEDVSSLHERLAATRFPDAIDGTNWEYGADRSYMMELVTYWREEFDWREREEALNALPQFTSIIDGNRIHYIYARGNGPNPIPIILTHGWPSSFAEFMRLIPLLTDPAAHGGDSGDAFDVIVPSLPGYGFSERPNQRGMMTRRVAKLWRELMVKELGYSHFVAHGGDIGAGVTNWLALDYPQDLTAIHVMAAPPIDIGASDQLSAEETEYLDYCDWWMEEEGGYWAQQRTRPQTLAFGLNDSPVGLAAWIIEKWRAWSECGGDLESVLSKDELLTNVSIYWFTQTIGSSMRMYYEYRHQGDAKWQDQKIRIPARLFLTTEKVDLCPRVWAERAYQNLSFGCADRGGHFLSAENPELLARDLRDYFRHFRP